jgi:predicted secreted Zn-dependent protease
MQHEESAPEGGWLTREELAKQLKVSLPTVTRYGAQLPGYTCLRIGRCVRYRRVSEADQDRDHA